MEEEWFHIRPWTTTGPRTNETGDTSHSSPWASLDRARCNKKCSALQLGRMSLLGASGRKAQLTHKFDPRSFGITDTEDLRPAILLLKKRYWQQTKSSELLQKWLVVKHSSFWHPTCLCLVWCSEGGSCPPYIVQLMVRGVNGSHGSVSKRESQSSRKLRSDYGLAQRLKISTHHQKRRLHMLKRLHCIIKCWKMFADGSVASWESIRDGRLLYVLLYNEL